MKARGRYLVGVDFEADTKRKEPGLFVVPMRNNAPMWNHAETVTRAQFEALMDSVVDKMEKAEKPGKPKT